MRPLLLSLMLVGTAACGPPVDSLPPPAEPRFDLRTIETTHVDYEDPWRGFTKDYEYADGSHIHWVRATTRNESGAVTYTEEAELDEFGFRGRVRSWTSGGELRWVRELGYDPAFFQLVSIHEWFEDPDKHADAELSVDFWIDLDDRGRRCAEGGRGWGRGEDGTFLGHQGECVWTLCKGSRRRVVIGYLAGCNADYWDEDGLIRHQEAEFNGRGDLISSRDQDFRAGMEFDIARWYTPAYDEQDRLVSVDAWTSPDREGAPDLRYEFLWGDDAVLEVQRTTTDPEATNPFSLTRFEWLPHPTSGPSGWRVNRTFVDANDEPIGSGRWYTEEWTDSILVYHRLDADGTVLRTWTSELEPVALPEWAWDGGELSSR